MSLFEKLQGRKYVADMLVQGIPETWGGIMDRIEASIDASGDGENQKRFSDGFIIGAKSAIKCIRNKLAQAQEKQGK